MSDPVGEVLKAESRIEQTSLFKRKKRKYIRHTPAPEKRQRLGTDQ